MRAARSARLAWLQHRCGLVGLGGGVIVLAVVVVAFGVKAHLVWDGLSNCGATKCIGTTPSSFYSMKPWGLYPPLMGIVLRVVPLAVGMFLGAPLIAAELESGTYRFTWTQSAGRRRAIGSTMIVTAAGVVLGSLLLGWLFWWSCTPYFAVGVTSGWGPALFGVGPFMLVGWSALAYVTGVLIGAVTRRVVPAIAVSALVILGLFGLSGFFLEETTFATFAETTTSIAPLYVPPIGDGLGAEGPFDIVMPPNAIASPGAWLVSGRYLGPRGRLMTSGEMYQMNGHLPPPEQSQASQVRAQLRWLHEHSERLVVAYQPAGRYWPFQAGEAVILLLLAGGVVLATSRVVRRS
jgi:hypothetical protein